MGSGATGACVRAAACAVALLALHGCGLNKGADATAARSAQTLRRFADSMEPESNLARASGEVTYVRLRAIFPDEDARRYHLDEREVEPFGYAEGLSAFLKLNERPYNSAAQFALLSKIEGLCNSASMGYISSALFNYQNAILSSDPPTLTDAEKLVLAAARNAWLHPYALSDPPVQALAELYRKIRDLPPDPADMYPGEPASTAPERLARKALCIASLRAPLFWMGNPGPEDVVRRLALDLGRRVPTLRELEDYRDGRLKLEDFVRKIQGETGYTRAVNAWHKDWLGLRPPAIVATDIRPAAGHYGSNLGNATFLGSSPMPVGSITSMAAPAAMRDQLELYSPPSPGSSAMNSENCADFEQDFDPRTVEIRWEQRNPALSSLPEPLQWEHLGSWRMKRSASGAYTGEWEQVPGEITLADGTKKTVRLEDIRMPESDPSGWDAARNQFRYAYKGGALKGTPMDGFYSGIMRATPAGPVAYYNSDQRRVRRFSPSGEQNGKSKIRLYYSGQTVYACNNLARFYATCAFRPKSRANVMGYYQTFEWNATIPRVMIPSSLHFYFSDTFMHPEILESMRCGIPAYDAISRIKDFPIPPELDRQAYPHGYDPNPAAFSAPIAQAALNPVAINPWINVNHGNYAGQPEAKALRRMMSDHADEPYRLLEDILQASSGPSAEKDYRLLLTANYTFGHQEFEILMRSQGYYLPGYPPGFARSDAEAASEALRKIDFSSIPSFSAQLLRNSLGEYSIYDNTERNPALPDMQTIIAKGSIDPKVHSGILTMTAFTQPAGLKTRTLASRYFVRLLCGNEAMYSPTGSAAELHESFIPRGEASAGAHLDRSRGCYGCHVNLDPLASVLGSHFQDNVFNPSWHETRLMTSDAYGMGIYGVRSVAGVVSQGAFFGRKVTGGIRELAALIADSREFGSCAVKKAFENLFGRAPQPADLALIKSVTDRFMSHHRYNQMVRDLVLSDEYRRRN